MEKNQNKFSDREKSSIKVIKTKLGEFFKEEGFADYNETEYSIEFGEVTVPLSYEEE